MKRHCEETAQPCWKEKSTITGSYDISHDSTCDSLGIPRTHACPVCEKNMDSLSPKRKK